MNNSAAKYLTALKIINARSRLVVKYSMTGIKEPIIIKLEPSAEKGKRNIKLSIAGYPTIHYSAMLRYVRMECNGGKYCGCRRWKLRRKLYLILFYLSYSCIYFYVIVYLFCYVLLVQLIVRFKIKTMARITLNKT